MADSKMADSTNTAYNADESPNTEVTNAASDIASDDLTYANVPPAPAANASSTPASATSATPPSSSLSSDNADGASAAEEPKPKVNNVDLLFLFNLTVDDFLLVRLITLMLRRLLPPTLDEDDILHRVITLLKAETTSSSSPSSSN